MYIDFEHVALIQSVQSPQWFFATDHQHLRFPSVCGNVPEHTAYISMRAQKRATSHHAAAGQFAMISSNQMVPRVFRVAAIAH
jgi:hypothetical protein